MGKDMVPKKIFFTKGVGKHRERLTSFELALRDAGIAAQNLVRVSSIFPPQCKLVPRSQGLKYLSPGEVVFAVVAENSTREPHRLLAASIGVAIPADRNTYGYLSEHHSFGETEDCRRRVCRGARRGDAGHDAQRGVRSRPLVGREERDLPDFEQDRSDGERHAVGGRG